MLLVSFFDSKGLIHREYLCNWMVNAAIFVQILGRLHTALGNRRPSIKYFLHMDNAPVHTAQITCLHLLFSRLHTLPHPPYLLDLVLSNFWFHNRVKKALRGRRCQSLDDLEQAADEEIGIISSEEFKHCILNFWPVQWAQCVHHDSAYLEGMD